MTEHESTLPVHGRIEGYPVADNCLCIGGRKLTEILPTEDATPVYIYDRELIRKRVRRLRALFPPRVKIHYAIKANPHPEIVDTLAQLVDGFDVASAGELRIALDSKMPPAEISFAGPGKRNAEIERAIRSGIVLSVESEGELERATHFCEEHRLNARIAVRVNPSFELKSSGMKMSGGPKPFGIDAERVPQMLARVRHPNIHFEGFHIFSGSQNLNSASICEAQTKSVQLALELVATSGLHPQFLNIGGGFGIPLFPGDVPLEIEPIAANLRALDDLVAKSSPGTALVIELGRYLVGEAGIYVCTVVDVKVSRGQTFLVANGGLHHHLAASGNFGQVIRKNYPILLGNRVMDTRRSKVNVVGPLCTPLDILGDKVDLPEASIGDLVVVMQSGAYGFTASPRGFLSHPEPRELVV